MTVSTTVRKAGPFTGNGVTTVFPFAFKVFSTTDVVATAALAGVEVVLALGTDYAVTLNADQDAAPGGQITTTIPLAVSRVLVLTSAVPQTQLTLITNAGGFFPKVFNAVFDKAVVLIQQLAEKVGRSVTIPVTATGVTNLQVPVLASAVLQWSADGSQLTAITLPSLALQLALPAMAGQARSMLTNDGVATASWSPIQLADVVGLVSALNYCRAAVAQVPTLAQINAAQAVQAAALQAAFPSQNFAINAAVIF